LEGAIKETQNALTKFEIAREGQKVCIYKSNHLFFNLKENKIIICLYFEIKIAEYLKKYMDDKFEPYWHVFFGKNFGC